MLLIDLTHTAHTRARTGVQRVCRSVYMAGQKRTALTGCTYDRFEKTWRSLRGWENANLASQAAAEHRGAQWPVTQRWRSRLQRTFRLRAQVLTPANGLIVPEIFSAQTAQHFPELFRHVNGPKIAVFHDAIALKFPELTPVKTVARFPAYLQELRQFDGIAAVSEDSRQTLLDYWRWAGITNAPIVKTIPLAAPLPSFDRSSEHHKAAGSARIPIILCVGSIEGRKNHRALFDAVESLWQKGLLFELHLVGMAHPETGRSALAKLNELQRAGRPIRWDGAVSEAALEEAYATCDFTVYPSLMEGFGLPVLESLHHGKPCICSARGALGEAAHGGGCLTIESPGVADLARSIETVLSDLTLREKLATEALARPGRTWETYTNELLAFIDEQRGANGRR